MEYSESLHRPLHIYLDDAWYFVTASTIDHTRYLSTEAHLKIWQDTFLELASKFGITICAWVVLENHYHIIVQPKLGRDIGEFIGQLHGRTSRYINLLYNAQGRQIWYSYWDTCIRDETGFWTRLNYIHYNPVKHRYVENPEEWRFSSYRFYLEQEGEEWLANCWLQYNNDEHLQIDDIE
jgi:putative transposase